MYLFVYVSRDVRTKRIRVVGPKKRPHETRPRQNEQPGFGDFGPIGVSSLLAGSQGVEPNPREEVNVLSFGFWCLFSVFRFVFPVPIYLQGFVFLPVCDE